MKSEEIFPVNLPIIKTTNPILRTLLLLVVVSKACYSCFFVVIWGLFLAPIRLINVSLYQKLESLAWIYGAKLAIFVSNMSAGIPFYVYGDYVHDGGVNFGRQLFVANHVSSADWLIHLFQAGRNGSGSLRFFLKSMHKYVPILGWACILHDMIFLTRDIKEDRPVLKKQLTIFNQNQTDNFLIIYPEGTFTTPENTWLVEKSQKWSKDNGQKVLQNVLTPRTTGFELLMETKEAFDYVVDLTCGFSKPYSMKLAAVQPPTLIDFFQHNIEQPVKIHLHYKKYKVADIIDKPADWLLKRFEEKDTLLEYFEKHGCFPGPGHAVRDDWWDLTMTFLFTCAFEGLTSYFVHCWFPKIVYSGMALCVATTIIVFLYDLQHQKKKVRESKVKTE
jgi:1-acyl-sn-glycerol-3-phosphate acyltransferase